MADTMSWTATAERATDGSYVGRLGEDVLVTGRTLPAVVRRLARAWVDLVDDLGAPAEEPNQS